MFVKKKKKKRLKHVTFTLTADIQPRLFTRSHLLLHVNEVIRGLFILAGKK